VKESPQTKKAQAEKDSLTHERRGGGSHEGAWAEPSGPCKAQPGMAQHPAAEVKSGKKSVNS